jgi:diacylglycerol kinase family enzyme
MQGLLGTAAVMGIIPKGSGNGMARNMGIPLQLDAAMRVINAGDIVATDIAFAGDKPFISNAGVAFDAQIAHEFAASKRRGLLIYAWLVTKKLWSYRPMDFSINVDGRHYTEKAFMVVVANGRQFGYNFSIAPMADHTDGLLDVIVIRQFPRLMGALISWQAMNGTLAQSRYVRHLRGKAISIQHPSLELMQLDGDAHRCTANVQFTVSQGALRVLAPRL